MIHNVEISDILQPEPSVELREQRSRSSVAAFDARAELTERKIRLSRRPTTSPLHRSGVSADSPKHGNRRAPFVLVGSSASLAKHKYVLDERSWSSAETERETEKETDRELLAASYSDASIVRGAETAARARQQRAARRAFPRPKTSKLPLLCKSVEEKRPSLALNVTSTTHTNIHILDVPLNFSPSLFSHELSDDLSLEESVTHSLSQSAPPVEVTGIEPDKAMDRATDGEKETERAEAAETAAETEEEREREAQKERERRGLFYDLWLTSHNGDTQAVDALNVDLLCQLETSLSKVRNALFLAEEEEAQKQQQEEEQEQEREKEENKGEDVKAQEKEGVDDSDDPFSHSLLSRTLSTNISRRTTQAHTHSTDNSISAGKRTRDTLIDTPLTAAREAEKEREKEERPRWTAQRVKAARTAATAAMAALDVLVNEVGAKVPVLRDVRDALLPLLFHSREDAHAHTRAQSHNQRLTTHSRNVSRRPSHSHTDTPHIPLPSQANHHTVPSRSTSRRPSHSHAEHDHVTAAFTDPTQPKTTEPRVSLMISQYSDFHSFAEKWLEAHNALTQLRSEHEKLEENFSSVSERLRESEKEREAQRENVRIAEEIRRTHDEKERETHVRFAEKEKEVLQLQRERETQSARVKALESEKEHLRFSLTSQEYKNKQVESKSVELFNSLEKTKAERDQLKRERRELKVEVAELTDVNKRQSVSLATEKVRNEERVAAMHDLLVNCFADFVDVQAPDAEREKARRMREKDKVFDPAQEAVVRLEEQSHTIISRVQTERQNLQKVLSDTEASLQQLQADFERTKKENSEYVSNLQNEHREEIQNLNKSHTAVHDNLRKAGLKKEFEKAALSSALNNMREEAKFLRKQVAELTESYEEKLHVLKAECDMWRARDEMRENDFLDARALRRVQSEVRDRERDILLFKQQLSMAQITIQELHIEIAHEKKESEQAMWAHREEIGRLEVAHHKDLSQLDERCAESEERALFSQEELLFVRDECVRIVEREREAKAKCEKLLKHHEKEMEIIEHKLRASEREREKAEKEKEKEKEKRARRAVTAHTQTELTGECVSVAQRETDTHRAVVSVTTTVSTKALSAEVVDIYGTKEIQEEREEAIQKVKIETESRKEKLKNEEVEENEDDEQAEGEKEGPRTRHTHQRRRSPSLSESESESGKESEISSFDSEKERKEREERHAERRRTRAALVAKEREQELEREREKIRKEERAKAAERERHEEVQRRALQIALQAQQKATLFDTEYRPVEASHVGSAQAWQYLTDRLKEEKGRFHELQNYLCEERKKIAQEMQRYSKMLADLHHSLPQQLTAHVNEISRNNLSQLISSEIHNRVSARPNQTSHIEGSSVEDEITRLNARELITLGKSLRKLLTRNNTVKGEVLVEEEKEEEEEEMRLPTQIEYANPEKMKRKATLHALIKAKSMSKGTQTVDVTLSGPWSSFSASESHSTALALVDAPQTSITAHFPHRLRSSVARQHNYSRHTDDGHTHAQTHHASRVSPQMISQPFIGFVRRHEKVLARECALMKVALRECRGVFQRLSQHVSQRIEALSTATTRTQQTGTEVLSAAERARQRVRVRSMQEMLGEMRTIHNALDNQQWLFEPALFVRRVQTHPSQDAVDVAAQTRMRAAYQDLLVTERERLRTLTRHEAAQHMMFDDGDTLDAAEMERERCAAVVTALEGLVADLTGRLRAHGGWHALLFRTDGSVDVDMEIEGFAPEEQLAICLEKTRFLRRQMLEANDDRDRERKAYQKEIAALHEQLLTVRESALCGRPHAPSGTTTAHGVEDFFDDERVSQEQGVNTDESECVVFSAPAWLAFHNNLRAATQSVREALQTSQAAMYAQEEVKQASFAKAETMEALHALGDCEELQAISSIAGLVTQNRKTPISRSVTALDENFVSFVQPLSKHRPQSALPGVAVKNIESQKKTRPWTSNTWKQAERAAVEMTGGSQQSHSQHSQTQPLPASAPASRTHSSSVTSSLLPGFDLSGSPKRIENKNAPTVPTVQWESLLEKTNDAQLPRVESVVTELAHTSQTLQNVLQAVGQPLFQQLQLQRSVLSNLSFAAAHEGRAQSHRSFAFNDSIMSERDLGAENNAGSAVDTSLYIGEAALDDNKCQRVPSTASMSLPVGRSASYENEVAQISRSLLQQESLTQLDPERAISPTDGAEGKTQPRNRAYEELFAAVYSFSQQQQHTDLQHYAIMLFDRFREQHDEARRTKKALVSLQNSHHIFENDKFLSMINGKQDEKALREMRLSHQLRPHVHKTDEKRLRDYIARRHPPAPRSHVGFHVRNVSLTRAGEDEEYDIANDTENSSSLKRFDESIFRERVLLSQQKSDPLPSLANPDDEQSLIRPTPQIDVEAQRRQQNIVQSSISVAQQHYSSPLLGSSVRSATLVVEEKEKDEKPVEVEPSTETQLLMENLTKGKATQWYQSFSDVI